MAAVVPKMCLYRVDASESVRAAVGLIWRVR